MTVFKEVSVDRIMEIGHAFRASRALLSAVELGVFTLLDAGPLNAESLAKKAGINGRSARDFLDALVALGMLERDDAGRYDNTSEANHYLVQGKAAYIGDLLESFGNGQFGVWASLTTALKTGRPQSNRSMVSGFSTMYGDEKAREIFAGGMTARTRPVAQALAQKFPWNKYKTFIDVGTAEGCLPVEIARAHPHIIGGGFDLPALEPQFNALVEKFLLADRLRYYPGDFFNDSLPSAEVIVLGRVLHNWDLKTKEMLLAKAYDALPNSGRLIVYERLIDDKRRVNATALLSSLNMLLMSEGGSDFTGTDCVSWMYQAGFRDIAVEPLTDEQSMVVALK